MNQITVSEPSVKPGFRKPYFIPELNCEGLSSVDIAEALNVPFSRINEKIERPAFRDMIANNRYVLIAAAIKSEGRGRRAKL